MIESENNVRNKISQLFENAMVALEANEANKQEIIRQLARDLENHGMPINTISEEITRVLGEKGKGFATSRYIRKCLEKKYKKEESQNNVIEERGSSSASEQESELKIPVAITKDGKSTIEPDFKGIANNKELENNNDDKNLEIGKLKEDNEQLLKQVKEMAAALNLANKKDKKIEESAEYQALKSQLMIVEQERDEYKQVATNNLKEHPEQTFQSASKLSPIESLASVKRENEGSYEVEFPAKDIGTFFMDCRNAKQFMIVKIENGKVVGWESDIKRNGRLQRK